jgi:UDP-GlcNAc3NAcA epimerase
MKKILSIIGARPQFVKIMPITRAVSSVFQHVIVHTGQHYDDPMSKVFFRDLHIPAPQYNLGVGSGTHASQTAAMLVGLETVLNKERPDLVMVYGDTNSTLAGALAAAKLDLPVAHVESGLRSFNISMSEEVNRVLVDRISALLFCPTRTAMENLANEGIRKGVVHSGDVMLDALLMCKPDANRSVWMMERLGLTKRGYYLATVHRAANTDDRQRLLQILEAFGRLDRPLVFPMHPRTKRAIERFELSLHANVRLLDPIGYLDMLSLEMNARKILTDSGGVQKEAYCLSVPCITLREATEWVETLDNGWNTLVGAETDAIVLAAHARFVPGERGEPYGHGHASENICSILQEKLA